MDNTVREQIHRLLQEEDFNAVYDKSVNLVNENPSDYEAFWWMGVSLTLMGKYSEAIKALHEALKHADNEDEESIIMSSLAKKFILEKKFERAIDYANVSLELNPRNSEAIIMKSIAYVATGRKSDSQKLLEENLSKLEHYERAGAYALLRCKQQMLDSLRKAVEEEPYRKTIVLNDPEFRHYIRDKEFRKLLDLS